MYRGFIALFHANDPKTALRDFESAAREGPVRRMYPEGYYLIIWQFFARERDGQWGRLVFRRMQRSWRRAWAMGTIPDGPCRAWRESFAAWPGPVIEMLLRTKTPEAARAAADTGDANLRARRTCEVDFYTGLFRLRGAPAEARALLQRAADNCPPGTLAGLGARLEAGRFGS